MFIRIVRVRDLRYMQIAHNCYVSGGYPRQRVISSLGRYDEDRYRQIQDILRDMQKLKRMQEVIDEIKNLQYSQVWDPAASLDCGRGPERVKEAQPLWPEHQKSELPPPPKYQNRQG